ncbi:unnamed protein product [Rotaria magnacalcarata]|uniref:Uncharacterized protein n=3 Tax=Rotaria magnacalcarata TaxID=392030 RepID=A0A815ZUK8_9BILA|nr:unnamed protein product [Rotaria magnacalcarata]CAF4265888.1 unnamed protein product [Rotaria magnacalcarata]
MMYGRLPILPLDHQDDNVTLSYDSTHINKLNQFLSKLNEQAKINIIRNQERYKQRHDINRADSSYNIGDLVLVKTLNIRHKFDIRYEGPFRIIKQLTQKTFIIQHDKKSTLHLILSQREYEDLLWKIKNIPSTITGKKRHNLRTTFKKKLHEHELATKYPPFELLKFEQLFINFRTTDSTLIHLIDQIKSTTVFTLDTESVLIPYQPNAAALIQVQIILSESVSSVELIEMCHLPRAYEHTFTLVKQFFQTLFNADNNIFIWENINELHSFCSYNLFTYDQLDLCNPINLQNAFKTHWNEQHPHQPTTSSASINYSDLAFELSEWWDKRQTTSSFDIGLDPTLYHFNSAEIEHRQSLVRYAVYDCLSMQLIMLKLKLIEPQESNINPSNEIVAATLNDITDMTSDDDQHDLPATNNFEPISPTDIQADSIPKRQQTLTKAERRRIHNRTSTLKQRKRYYKTEIIISNIDRRFTTKEIQGIIKSYGVPYSAANFSTSSTIRKRSVHIGMRKSSQINDYQHRIDHLFTTSPFNRFIHGRRTNK